MLAGKMATLLATTDNGAVATWTGVFSSVVSIVLSLVAIVFARDVDRRSMEVNNQTIRSLETIQATVQRLSDDTGGLIKMAWERMLGSVALPSTVPSTVPSRSDSQLEGTLTGLLGEFRQDASELTYGAGIEKLAHDMGERMRRAARQRQDDEADSTPHSWAFNLVVAAIETMSPLAIELLRHLARGQPLTRDQYSRLKRDAELASAIDELRDRDILMPFQKRGPKGEETFYRIAPWFQDVIGPALVFTGHETASGRNQRGSLTSSGKSMPARNRSPAPRATRHRVAACRTNKATSKDGAHKGAGRDGDRPRDRGMSGSPPAQKMKAEDEIGQLRGWH